MIEIVKKWYLAAKRFFINIYKDIVDMPSNIQLKQENAKLKKDISNMDIVIADLEKQVADLKNAAAIVTLSDEVEVVLSDTTAKDKEIQRLKDEIASLTKPQDKRKGWFY
jgi:predicted  nucleic acid-binding Zn-ribbon protein